MIFVDDDSPDSTAELVRSFQDNPRVRCLQRIGRKGLSSACIEGILASSAPYVAVIDADLQHDVSLLPKMLEVLKRENLDIVSGSRYMEHGSTGELADSRVRISTWATRFTRFVTRTDLTDPMSGFFMVPRRFFDETARDLSGKGFKILLDLFLSAKRKPAYRELPYVMRTRQFGESKLDTLVVLEFAIVIADKLIGWLLPVSFVLFVLVGLLGAVVHLGALSLFFVTLGLPFIWSQAGATVLAMTMNYVFNKQPDLPRSPAKGIAVLARAPGLLSGLRDRGLRELHPGRVPLRAGRALVAVRPLGGGGGRGLELRRFLHPDLATRQASHALDAGRRPAARGVSALARRRAPEDLSPSPGAALCRHRGGLGPLGGRPLRPQRPPDGGRLPDLLDRGEGDHGRATPCRPTIRISCSPPKRRPCRGVTDRFPWLYPPHFLFYVLPLGLLSYGLAFLLWNAVTLGALAWGTRRIAGHSLAPWILAASPATLWVFSQGQNGFLTAALLAAGLALLPRRPLLAGLCFGLMTFKPQLGLLLPLALLCGRQWLAIAGAAATFFLLVAASLLAFGWEIWPAFYQGLDYAGLLLEQEQVKLKRLASVYGLMRQVGLGPSLAMAAHVAVALPVAGLVAWVWWRRARPALCAAMLAAGSVLLSPFLYDYDLMFYAVAIAFLTRDALENGWLKGERSTYLVLWTLPFLGTVLSSMIDLQVASIGSLTLLALAWRRVRLISA